MDEDNNVEKSDSTDEVDEKSDTETECFDKGDSDSLSQSDKPKELKCTQCKINFKIFDELETHKKHHHPMIVYRCTIDNCPRWFSSRRSRDKHSENVRSRLHKSSIIKPPPPNAIFIENASPEQMEIVKIYTNVVNRGKGKRGPKPKYFADETEKKVPLPRDQAKRKLMECVSEKMESFQNKKSSQDSSSSVSLSKRRPSIGQLSRCSSTTIPTVSSPKPQLQSKSLPVKVSDIEPRTLPTVIAPKHKLVPNFSQLKVPILPMDSERFVLQKFSEDIITLLTNYDVAGYFKYPLIDHYAPGSSQLLDQIDMATIKDKLKQGQYSKEISNLKCDLLKLYSNGLDCFNEKSAGWQEAAKLYQTATLNIQNAERKLVQCPLDSRDWKLKSDIDSNDCEDNNDSSTNLRILNPYNRGTVNDHERVASIGEQAGLLKSATKYLNNYKEDRRNKISILSYLDYGANFSFGPSYDSGNAYCTKEVSDLLIRGYGDEIDEEEEAQRYRELNEIIPETGLGDDFSLYLMNMFTRDILRSQVSGPGDEESGECVSGGGGGGGDGSGGERGDCVSDGGIQAMLDDNGQQLKQLRSLNYQRLSALEVEPSGQEWICAQRVTDNLVALISHVTPDEVTDRDGLRRALDLVL